MKQLRFKHAVLTKLTDDEPQMLLVLGDAHDVSVDDQIELIDNEAETAVGIITINEVVAKHLGDFEDANQAVVIFEKGGDAFTSDTVAKHLLYTYQAYDQPKPLATSDVSKTTELTEVKLYGDGGSRGNPGPAASGWVITDLADHIIKEGGYYLGESTNNQAEYTALKKGLEDVLEMGIKKVQVFMDSQLVVNQVNGSYKVKNAGLMPIFTDIKQLAELFDTISFTHVPRALNKEADRMVNEVLDAEAAKNG